MCVKTERTQVLLTPEQRQRVERVAAMRGTSIGAVIRRAIDEHVGDVAAEDAMAALFSLDAPVGDWADLKREIIDGATT